MNKRSFNCCSLTKTQAHSWKKQRRTRRSPNKDAPPRPGHRADVDVGGRIRANSSPPKPLNGQGWSSSRASSRSDRRNHDVRTKSPFPPKATVISTTLTRRSCQFTPARPKYGRTTLADWRRTSGECSEESYLHAASTKLKSKNFVIGGAGCLRSPQLTRASVIFL